MLLLSITNKLLEDVAPVPLLWVLPLALYLLKHLRWPSAAHLLLARRIGSFSRGCAGQLGLRHL